MQAFYAQNLILIVNFRRFGEIRTESDKLGREIPRQKMHALKIAQRLEPQGFEGCERCIFRKLSSYYIHHLQAFHEVQKSGYNIPTDEIKGRV